MGEGYTLGVLAPTPRRLFLSFMLVAVVLFVRPPSTNFIFDEQEALLGNPYLQEGTSLFEAMSRDFWGRSAEQSIGAYRPVPNILWKPLAGTLAWRTPWFFCLINLLLHASTASVVSLSIARFLESSGAPSEKSAMAAWGGGFFFVVCATSTEAVCSAVGVADILVGWSSALCVWFISGRRIALNWLGGLRFFALVLLCSLLGLFSKETMIGTALSLPFCAWLIIKDRAQGWIAVIVTLLASTSALLLFVWTRGLFFLSKKSELTLIVPDGPLAGSVRLFFGWFSQPKMPVDPLNNPLFQANAVERMSTACAMFAEQVAQIFFPLRLHADYSFPRQEIVGWNATSAAGAFLLILAACASIGVLASRARKKPLSTGGMLTLVGVVWMLVSYLPISNAVVLLPTIRADRLLYSPTLGAAFVFAGLVASAGTQLARGAVFSAIGYLCFQGVQARIHALIYSDDVSFWRATSSGENASAKSLLNMGVMLGARGDEVARISYTQAALQKAPDWPMARVYLGDAYCRSGDMDAAYSHLRRGFEMAPESKALTALGLQCMWEKGGYAEHRGDLLHLAEKHPETWLDYFVAELEENGERHGGIPGQFRPRKYNEPAAIK